MVVRRTFTVLAAATLLVLGGLEAAGAAFSERTLPVQTTVSTLAVAPPTDVRVETYCTTTTVETERTYQVDPVTGTATEVGYSQATTVVTSTTNQQSETTVRTDDPATGQYTITHTLVDTELYATGRWKPSTSTGVTGYRLAAILTGGWVHPLEDAAPTATSVSGQYDAEVVDWEARLAMVTLTSYGWTANSVSSNVVTCTSR